MSRKFRDAFRGLGIMAQDHSVRLQLLNAAMAALAAGLLRFSALEFAIVLTLCALVICLEAANSAIERVCDRMSREEDESIKEIKDLMAGTVLAAGIFSLIVGLILVIRHL